MRTLALLVFLTALPSVAVAYECEYRRVNLRDMRTVQVTVGVRTTHALIEKGMTGVVEFMEREAGRWVYRIRWDAGLVLNRIVPPVGPAIDYYFPQPGILEDNVLRS